MVVRCRIAPSPIGWTSDADARNVWECTTTEPRSTCQYTKIPRPPYRECHSVNRFWFQDRKWVESDATEVDPSPHRPRSLAAKVASAIALAIERAASEER